MLAYKMAHVHVLHAEFQKYEVQRAELTRSITELTPAGNQPAESAESLLGREPRVAAGPFSGQVEPGSPHSPSRRDAGLEDVRGIEQPRKLAK